MKKKILSFATISLIAILSSCSKKGSDSTPNPVANFSYTPIGSNTHAPATIKFSNSSVNGLNYSWNFGDGTSSSQDEPSHKYSGAGTYTVTLTASYAGKTNTKTQTVNIQAPYTKVALTKINLSAVVETGSFTGYFRFSDVSNGELWRSANITINPSVLPGVWSLTTPYVFTNLFQTYYIEVWKVGVISNTKLASGPLVPSLYNIGTNEINSYPASIMSIDGLSFNVQWQ